MSEPPAERPGDVRIVTVLRPVRIDAVMQELHHLGLDSVLIEQVRGYGRQKSHLAFYEQGAWEGGFLPKVRIELTAPRARSDEVVKAIRRGARTGRIGDGKIFVHDVEPLAEMAS